MVDRVILLSVPGLRPKDLADMPRLSALAARGETAELVPSFPAVTWPVQTNMLTGRPPRDHGVVANGWYWRDQQRVEMWTAGNEVICRPQIWDLLGQQRPELTSAAWFPMLGKRAHAHYICMPQPLHNPDGSETPWCYSRPDSLYRQLIDEEGPFPLQHFWGPLANIRSTHWIARSAIQVARRARPDFFFIYLPHLDYAAQRTGPDSPAAQLAVAELDGVLGELLEGFEAAYPVGQLVWLIAGEYAITPVRHVAYPNRVLRELGLLSVQRRDGAEYLDLMTSQAWALVDHQFAHVFVAGSDQVRQQRIAESFRRVEGIEEVLVGPQRAKYAMDHERSGEIILVSAPHSWQAYYWWLDDQAAPPFARTVDIHQKPGYDPVELHFDPVTRSIPLDATLVRGSHGAPVRQAGQLSALVCSRPGVLKQSRLDDRDLAEIVLGQFGLAGLI